MAKLDFSSLKTADLRSVAPVDESAIPRAQGASWTESPVSTSVPQEATVQAPQSPASVAAPAAAQAVQETQVSAPAVQTPLRASPAHASKKISLTSLKTGGSSVVRAAPASVAAPAAAQAVQEVVRQAAPITLSAGAKRAGTTISLGTKPSATAPAAAASEEAAVPATEAVENSKEPAEEIRTPVEGVDIIEAAKVIGTEGEAKANEILDEALKDPEAAKKEAEEKAVAAVVIPETEKEFFPNLEMDDDFFKDPLFEGIVPPKPEKKPEVRLPLEMKKEEPDAEPEPVEVATQDAVAIPEAATEIPTEEVRQETEAVPVAEEVPTVADSEASAPEAGVADESVVETRPPAEAAPEAYVEAVAKDLSAERKGGLSKLFGERKILVRTMAGFFAFAILAAGAFSFVSPSIKTSGPESVNTGSEVPKYVPTGETRVVGEGVRVFTGRRPNAHKNKKTAMPATATGASVSGGPETSESGSALLPSAVPQSVGTGSSEFGSGASSLASTGSETLSGADVPQNVTTAPPSMSGSSGSADAPAPEAPPQPPVPMPN